MRFFKSAPRRGVARNSNNSRSISLLRKYKLQNADQARKKYSVRSWGKSVGTEHMNCLWDEAKKLWDFYGGCRSQAKSFWISLQRDEDEENVQQHEPRCHLEAFAQSVAQKHNPQAKGAEFWVQYRSGNMLSHGTTHSAKRVTLTAAAAALGITTEDAKAGRVNDTEGGLEFHFDKDEEAVNRYDRWRHPDISTVTYLAPTPSSNNNNSKGKNSSSSGGSSRSSGDSTADGLSKVDIPALGAPLVVFSTQSIDDDPLPTSRGPAVPEIKSNNGNDSFASSGSSTRLKPRCIPQAAASPEYSWILFPIPGSHVCFAGNMLHGVPSELNASLARQEGDKTNRRSKISSNSSGQDVNDYQRMSFPVNVWTESKPLGAEPLPQAFINSLVTPTAGGGGGGGDPNTTAKISSGYSGRIGGSASGDKLAAIDAADEIQENSFVEITAVPKLKADGSIDTYTGIATGLPCSNSPSSIIGCNDSNSKKKQKNSDSRSNRNGGGGGTAGDDDDDEIKTYIGGEEEERSWWVLQEHKDGDTGVLPIGTLRAALRAATTTTTTYSTTYSNSTTDYYSSISAPIDHQTSNNISKEKTINNCYDDTTISCHRRKDSSNSNNNSNSSCSKLSSTPATHHYAGHPIKTRCNNNIGGVMVNYAAPLSAMTVAVKRQWFATQKFSNYV